MKQVIWIGDSLKNLKRFPKEVQNNIGYTLHKIQEGWASRNVKQLKGLKPAVMEIMSNYDTNTYRAVYTVKISDVLYVLHCFQKKSNEGIKTPKYEIDLIKQRLQEAQNINKIAEDL